MIARHLIRPGLHVFVVVNQREGRKAVFVAVAPDSAIGRPHIFSGETSREGPPGPGPGPGPGPENRSEPPPFGPG